MSDQKETPTITNRDGTPFVRKPHEPRCGLCGRISIFWRGTPQEKRWLRTGLCTKCEKLAWRSW